MEPVHSGKAPDQAVGVAHAARDRARARPLASAKGVVWAAAAKVQVVAVKAPAVAARAWVAAAGVDDPAYMG